MAISWVQQHASTDWFEASDAAKCSSFFCLLLWQQSFIKVRCRAINPNVLPIPKKKLLKTATDSSSRFLAMAVAIVVAAYDSASGVIFFKSEHSSIRITNSVYA